MRILTTIFTLLATTANATPDCKALTQLAEELRNGAAPTALVGAEFCMQSRGTTGEVSFHCAWGFEFRDDAARVMAQNVVQTAQTCLNAQPQGEEAGVNHPDTFDQVTLLAPDVSMTVSVKDKGAQNRTLVFLGVSPR